MANGLTAKDYPVYETGVRFRSDDIALQRVFERCEALCKENLEFFGDKTVLKEGAKYNGVWLETQPIGGEMYAKRDISVALNNQLIFFENQRIDGRLPGMITFSLPFRGITPHYSWMQGNFLPYAALKVGYLIGKDRGYLERLYRTLHAFDEYLWSCRDSDGNGCLEAWCVWDTGADNFTEFLANGVHAVNGGLCCGEEPPIGVGKLPFESAEYMAYSYANRAVLAELSVLLDNGEEQIWNEKAAAVQNKLYSYLWDDKKKACYDRDCDNKVIDCLSQNNIKCMHLGAFTQQMADDFIREHLMNRQEFFTPLPLPSIAANNSYFYLNEQQNNCTPDMLAVIQKMLAHDSMDNSWSGPCEGLTQQRLPDAMINYGHHAEVGLFGAKWISALSKNDRYVQQYDPFTGEAAVGSEGYGPTLLAALEYISLMYGINIAYDQVAWSSVEGGVASEYIQRMNGHEYTLSRDTLSMTALLDGKPLFTVTNGVRVYTDPDGTVSHLYGIAEHAIPITLMIGECSYQAIVQPNEELSLHDGELISTHLVPFTLPY